MYMNTFILIEFTEATPEHRPGSISTCRPCSRATIITRQLWRQQRRRIQSYRKLDTYCIRCCNLHCTIMYHIRYFNSSNLQPTGFHLCDKERATPAFTVFAFQALPFRALPFPFVICITLLEKWIVDIVAACIASGKVGNFHKISPMKAPLYIKV